MLSSILITSMDFNNAPTVLTTHVTPPAKSYYKLRKYTHTRTINIPTNNWPRGNANRIEIAPLAISQNTIIRLKVLTSSCRSPQVFYFLNAKIPCRAQYKHGDVKASSSQAATNNCMILVYNTISLVLFHALFDV